MTDAVVPEGWNFSPQARYDNSLPTSLSIITWNIDFATPDATRRLICAIDYLRYHAFPEHQGGRPPDCLILLQEVNIDVFNTLLAHPWVREWFEVVPASPEVAWPRGATYGTVTLVHAPLDKSMCVHYEDSYMGRSALVTDIMVGGAAEHHHGPRILRVINTHLESLPMGTPMRITQMGVIAGLLREAGTMGGIACGDMNAIAPSDATLPEQNGLSDAWEYRRDEEEGATWGYQPVNRYPPGRLDKILYTESDGFEVRDARRIGVGLKMPGGGEWVSDHYGLACHVGIRS